MTSFARWKSDIRTFEWWRRVLMEILVSVIAVYMITAFLEARQAAELRAEREALPAEAWLEVPEIYVPDHKVGSNPAMIYDADVKEAFRGAWVAEIQRRDRLSKGKFFAVCTGHGVNDYEPDETRKPTVKWKWFFGRPCAISPGLYQIVVTYEMRVPGFPIKRYEARSNVFEVLPPGAS